MLVYLRFALGYEADPAAFEEDLLAMRRLAEGRPGFHWSEVGRDPWNDRTYIVVSDWDEVEQVRDFEHHPEHEAIMSRWEDGYAEPFEHHRYVQWVRPVPMEGMS